MYLLVLLKDVEGLCLRNVHAQHFFFEKELGTFPFQFSQVVAFRCSGILMEEDQEGEDEDEHADGNHEEESAVVDEPFHRGPVFRCQEGDRHEDGGGTEQRSRARNRALRERGFP